MRSGGQVGNRVRCRSRRAPVGRARIHWLPVGPLRTGHWRTGAPSAAGGRAEWKVGGADGSPMCCRMRVTASVDVRCLRRQDGGRRGVILDLHREQCWEARGTQHPDWAPAAARGIGRRHHDAHLSDSHRLRGSHTHRPPCAATLHITRSSLLPGRCVYPKANLHPRSAFSLASPFDR